MCKVDIFTVSFFLVSFTQKTISHSINVTTLDVDNVLLVTQDKDTIVQYEISYSVLNFFVYVCVFTN